jgi:hypothetical protein
MFPSAKKAHRLIYGFYINGSVLGGGGTGDGWFGGIFGAFAATVKLEKDV